MLRKMNKVVLVSFLLVGLAATTFGEHEREERFILSTWVRGLGNNIMDKTEDVANLLGGNKIIMDVLQKSRNLGNQIIDVTEDLGAKVGIGAKAAANAEEAGFVVQPPIIDPLELEK